MLKKIFFYVKKFLRNKDRVQSIQCCKLDTHVFTSYDEYFEKNEENKDILYTQKKYEKSLYTSTQSFFTKCFCAVCNEEVEFLTTFDYSYKDAHTNELVPNYREHLKCPTCNLNNRMRASLHFLCANLGAKKASRVYITEQTTPTYKQLLNIFPHIIGSEYLGDTASHNNINSALRHEDLTNLTFEDKSFDYVVSFDVLEHIPRSCRHSL